MPILVYFYLLCNNKSYKKPSGFLRAEPLSCNFEDRRVIGEGNNQERFEVKKILSDKNVFPSLSAAPVNDDAKKHNENLPGMGGVFNVVNLHVYHYAGYSQRSFELYNPVKYVDPDGRNETIYTDEGRQIHKAIFEIYKAANAPDIVTGNTISMSKALSDLGEVDEGLGRTDLGLKPGYMEYDNK